MKSSPSPSSSSKPLKRKKKDKRSDRARSEEDRKKNTELKETVEKLENKNKQLERELTEVNGEIKRFKSMLSARCVIEWFEKFHLHMKKPWIKRHMKKPWIKRSRRQMEPPLRLDKPPASCPAPLSQFQCQRFNNESERSSSGYLREDFRSNPQFVSRSSFASNWKSTDIQRG